MLITRSSFLITSYLLLPKTMNFNPLPFTRSHHTFLIAIYSPPNLPTPIFLDPYPTPTLITFIIISSPLKVR